MTKQIREYDVLIAGGGLSGLTQALALSTISTHSKANENNTNESSAKQLKVAVVDQSRLLASTSALNNAPVDARVLALSYGSVEYLRSLELWSLIEDQACAIDNIHVSDLGHYGKARLTAQDYHREALGYVIELDVLQNALLSKLGECDNVDLIGESKIEKLSFDKDFAIASLADVAVDGSSADGSADVRECKAQLLLGCDGAQSPTRQMMAITPRTQDYQQVAVIANVETATPHHGRAFERFTDSGPLAMLPMRDLSGAKAGCCFSLVWTMSEAEAKQVLALDDNDFCQQLAERFGAWQGAIISASRRVSYPLKLVQVDELVRHRYALVGNAAHTLHPIAGQGFNLGVRDIKLLHQLIAGTVQKDGKLGDLRMLMNYQKQRLADHKNVITLTDTLVHTYSNQHLPLVIGRNIGVKALNYLTPVKNAFARFTMGQA